MSTRWAESGAQNLVHTAQQFAAIDAVINSEGYAPHLLFGVTGSGKTEVYLSAIARRLAADPTAQALLLVPEINLTPQLESLLRARFPNEYVVALHSNLADTERAAAGWRRTKGARASWSARGSPCSVRCRNLSIIVIDEEHDPSYKAGEGVRYSARDLAVKRAQLLDIPIVLGSATPSIESWAQAQVRPLSVAAIDRARWHGRLSAGATRSRADRCARAQAAAMDCRRRLRRP